MSPRCLGVLAALLATACGAPDAPAPTVELTLPWPQALSCANLGDLAGMRAGVKIGGHPLCELAVDGTTRQASGRCPNITVGILRPLMVMYWLDAPAGSTLAAAQLAYHVGYVDLDRAALSPGQTETTVTLVDDGVTGVMIVDDAQKDALLVSLPEGNLNRALNFFFKDEVPLPSLLDRDTDGCPNLPELCEWGYNALFETPNANDCN